MEIQKTLNSQSNPEKIPLAHLRGWGEGPRLEAQWEMTPRTGPS